MTASQVQDSCVYIVPPPHIVGDAFARQYYAILEQSPELVYRFYKDTSKLGRNSDNGVMNSTTTMDAIDKKIQSYGSLKADIKHVDAQESYNGGVMVLVVGSMVKDDDSRRGFTQTFFLAPQEKGYFILNDIFRYVDDVIQHNKNENGGIASIKPDEEETITVQANHFQANHVQENHVTKESNGEVYNLYENGKVSVEEKEEEVVEEEPLVEVVNEGPNDSQLEVDSKVKVVDDSPIDSQTPRKSYASIVMKDTIVTTLSPNVPKSMPKIQDQQMNVNPSVGPMPPPSRDDVLDDNSSHEPEGVCHSIYMKNLPYNVPYHVVEEALKIFGVIKSNSIQIRHANGFVFGFADFEEAGSAQSAIEASPITIGGRDVVVEEKRSTYRGNGQRPPLGRGGGGGYRGEANRGHASYGGGRGYGPAENRNGHGNRAETRSDYGNRAETRSDYGNRAETRSDYGNRAETRNDYGSRGETRSDYGNRGGGRGYYNHRNEGFQRSNQTGIGIGRGNRSGGSNIGTTMRTNRVPLYA